MSKKTTTPSLTLKPIKHINDDDFGNWYIGTNKRRKRDKLFRHLEKFEKGYRRKK